MQSLTEKEAIETREPRQASQVVFVIAALIILPATLALRTVLHPGVLQSTSNNPSPLGYPLSLLLFIVPVLALAGWFVYRSDLQIPRQAFWRTIAVLAPLGFGLDLLFGNIFLFFPTNTLPLESESPLWAEPSQSKSSFSILPGSCSCC